jgi:hypothetical protein
VDPNLRATVRSGFFQDLEQRYARRKCHPPQNNELHLRQELQWRVRYFGGHDIQQRQQCIHGFNAKIKPITTATGNASRFTQIRRRIFVTIRELKPSSAIGSASNADARKRSTASDVLSAILMIFDFKLRPDLFLGAVNNRFHRAGG